MDKDSMRSVVLRLANEEDLDAIIALEQLAFKGRSYKPEGLQAFYARFSDLVFVACGEDESIIGHTFGGGRANPAHDITDTDWVNSLAVHPDQRGCGLGGILLDELLKAFVARGLRQVMIYAQENNTPAMSLYYSRGFEVTIYPHPSGEVRVTLSSLIN